MDAPTGHTSTTCTTTPPSHLHYTFTTPTTPPRKLFYAPLPQLSPPPDAEASEAAVKSIIGEVFSDISFEEFEKEPEVRLRGK